MPASAEPASRRDWQEIFALLDSALELDPVQHPAWLDALPAEQARLSPMLKSLLQAHADVGTADFMGAPATFALPTEPTPPGLAAQSLVGPYRLLREIGQGGMASVWLADRPDGLLERQVALKLPHVSWGIASFAERMARERKILASLTHPNIARLYDAGVAADGRPFLALEYVDGQPIDAYAAAAGLTVRARVELAVQVARAVAYAHAHLVVHRDLKPSNILIDAQGQAHLLDFGIAKLVDPQFSDVADEGSQLTLATGRALTPDYASPEQIRGDAIGTASDIYSLGVVLFELLAGTRPYRLKSGLGAAALAEAIARVEAPRASVAAPTQRSSANWQAIWMRSWRRRSRRTRASAMRPSTHWPTTSNGTCAVSRSRRAPRRAGISPSAGCEGTRPSRRSCVALLVAALGGAYAQVLVLLALGGGAVVALWQRNRALRQAELARAALARAEQVKNFIASIFTQAVPRAGHGGAVTAVDLLQAAARRVESDLSAQPEIAAELGALIGTSFNDLGDYRAGLEWLPKVVELCTRTVGATHPFSLQSRYRLAEAANNMGELAVSESLLPALVRDLRAAQPPQTELLVHALESQAFVHTKRGGEAAAMAALNEAVEVATRTPAAPLAKLRSARARSCRTPFALRTHGPALEAIEPALAPARAAFGALRPHALLLIIERFHADALARHDRPREAAILLRQVLADQRALDAGETTRVRIAMTLLANALMLGGHLEEAQSLVAQSEALHERLTGGVNDEGIALASRHTR